MQHLAEVRTVDQQRALWASTIAFTVCFAVWTIFSIIGVQIKKDLGLNDTQFGLLVGTPILTGSLIRLMLGIWTDQYGGRIVYTAVMLSAAVATWLLTFAYDYPTFLLAALGVGIAGGSFAVGIAYVSKWYPIEQQGTALGIFGAGNVGAAVTKFVAPFIMVAYGWKAVANVWALAIAVMAIVFWLATKDDPQLEARRKAGAKPEPLSAMLEPLSQHPGLALLALLFLRVRRLRGAGAVAAPLPDGCLRPRHHHRRHDRRLLLGAGLALPHLWRCAVRQIRRTPRDVLDVRRFGRGLLPAVLPADRVRRAGHPRAHEFPAGNRARRLHRDRVRARLLHEPGQGRGLQTHPGLLPASMSARSAAWSAWSAGSGGFVLPILFGMLNDLTGVWQSCFMALFAISAARAGLDASRHPRHGEGRLRRGAQEAPRAPRDAGDPRAQARRRARPASDRGLAARGEGVLGARRAARSPAATY